MFNWFQKTQSCSPESHVFVYFLMAYAVFMAGVGVFVWFRFIKSKPGEKAKRVRAQSKSDVNSGAVMGSVPVLLHTDGV